MIKRCVCVHVKNSCYDPSLEAIKEKIDKLGNIKIKEHPLEKESKFFFLTTYTQRKPTIDEVKT